MISEFLTVQGDPACYGQRCPEMQSNEGEDSDDDTSERDQRRIQELYA